jgi:iron complex transport system substrate-binding protein
MKTKIIVLMGIALCTMLLISPALAGASENVLEIYGNANEDDTIDMRDLTYVKLIFFGKKPETELADAKYDGKINPLDFIQIKLIIVGKEKEITIVDSADRIVTVKKPLEKIVPYNLYCTETLRSLKLELDRIVGVVGFVHDEPLFYPELQDYPNLGCIFGPDIEKILSVNPDTVFLYGTFYKDKCNELQNTILEVNPNIHVLRFDCYKPESYVEEIKKMGYILDKKKEADEFIEFYKGCLNTIKEKVEGIPEDERPKVYLETGFGGYGTTGKGTVWHQTIEAAGGNNIFGDLSNPYPNVDPEEVVERNPEIIIKSPWIAECGYETDDITEFENIWNEMMSRVELAKVPAVEDKKVYIVDWDISVSPSNFVAMAYYAKWFHPDIFEDLDPRAIHQEYLDRFQHINFNVYEHGVFVYPPLKD